MPVMKTPGVYIVEKNAFPNSVVEVATAVPAFIGYTAKAEDKGKPLGLKPTRIGSLGEYVQYFGGPPKSRFKLAEAKAGEDAAFKQAGKAFVLEQVAGRYNLYRGMLQFFQNGGGPCFIVSVGQYGLPGVAEPKIDKDELVKGIETLVVEQEPTMLVIPDAVLLNQDEKDPEKRSDLCIAVQKQMLMHCGYKMKNRVAVLDVYDGDQLPKQGGPIDQFRNKLGTDQLDFAAAYYPFLHTTIVGDRDVGYDNFADPKELQPLLRADLGLPEQVDDKADIKLRMQDKALKDISKTDDEWKAEAKKEKPDAKEDDIDAWVRTNKLLLNNSLLAASPLFKTIVGEIKNRLNLLPPSPAMAGLYTMVDNTRGVWKAPANVSLAGVTKPAVNLSNEQQEDLNVTTGGKSINAIRSFIGEGVLVWGARTLDGNSLDWRYINVRRTMIMLEESCRLAAKAMVFEPNVSPTWVTIKSMISNFLTSIWKRGGLAGATPDDAFSVHVGLGETMTPEDILEGILRVTVLVAISRPAEFIEITFQQQMQKS